MDQQPADALQVAQRLASAANLPSAVSSEPVDLKSYGLDNQLTGVWLEDRRMVMLRQSSVVLVSPRPRVDFLRGNGVPVPELHATDDAGNALWEFVAGRPLADLVEEGTADDMVWWRTGAAMAAVHGVTFPAPLQGPIGPDVLQLRPVDPVDQLQVHVNAARGWVEHQRPHLVPVLDRIAAFTVANAERFRVERPAVTHGDVNLLNIIVGEEAVRLIDWDFPVVGYPLAELSALAEHAYLHGCDGLPTAFFSGYGREVPADLLLSYRIAGCFGWLSADDWAKWQSDPALPDAARDRLDRWHAQLLAWADRTPELIEALN